MRRINIGQSFAEYDPALDDETVYVHTPALAAALDGSSGKVFFVGRRGTGKTAIRRFCEENSTNSAVIVPAIFSPSSTIAQEVGPGYSRRRPFQSLVSAFRRCLQVELLQLYLAAHPARSEVSRVLLDEFDDLGSLDFDTRALAAIRRVIQPLENGDDEAWIRENKAARTIGDEMKSLGSSGQPTCTVLIDSIDDYWEGTEEGLVYLTAFMHACQEVSAQIPWARTILFLRENIFERIRSRDTESTRLETAVVGMEWSARQLLELVERRLNRTLTAKLPLNGETWKMYVEESEAAWGAILDYCQRRPRDVLIYVSNAVESAQAAGHDQISLDDVASARRRFSDNRLRDLGDEYSENYPRLDEVLKRFYGLGRSFTLTGIESLARKLLQDAELTRMCGPWIFEIAAPETFVRLLYNIGFAGVRTKTGASRFRALGPQDTTPPPVNDTTDIAIHQCYWDALDLQDILVASLNEDVEFGRVGLVQDLPGGVSAAEYSDHLDVIQESLRDLQHGAVGANDFEDIVGDVIRLCFFRSLDNVEARSRTADGRVVRDWVASNRASQGFWEVVRNRYGATQVIWECKNYAGLSADDFHQASYYMSEAGGRFVILAFRGEMKASYYDHVARVHRDNKGLILPLAERDLMTFIRQARNGKIKEDHIQDRYDALVRKIS
ncbi:MAG: transposase [Cellulomonadaceae bacterium]|nr:transposase [Cellulomonadaceae bacterium]